jgi:hypothetical protein
MKKKIFFKLLKNDKDKYTLVVDVTVLIIASVCCLKAAHRSADVVNSEKISRNV